MKIMQKLMLLVLIISAALIGSALAEPVILCKTKPDMMAWENGHTIQRDDILKTEKCFYLPDGWEVIESDETHAMIIVTVKDRKTNKEEKYWTSSHIGDD